MLLVERKLPSASFNPDAGPREQRESAFLPLYRSAQTALRCLSCPPTILDQASETVLALPHGAVLHATAQQAVRRTRFPPEIHHLQQACYRHRTSRQPRVRPLPHLVQTDEQVRFPYLLLPLQ